MPFANVNGIDICYELDGDPDGPPVLLVAGLGVQLIDWPAPVVAAMVAAGHHVIRYDNRDVGLSTSFDDAPSDAGAAMQALLAGEDPRLAYGLHDMAADGAALLDSLNIESAHIVGVSLGGMIAQTMAIDFSHKVRSLTSIMSTTGNPAVGQPSEAAMMALISGGDGGNRDADIAQGMKNAEVWASPGHFDASAMRSMLTAAWDRVQGTQAPHSARQLSAVMASESRDVALAQLSVPALVVHGDADPLIDQSGGRRTASSIPGAELMIVEGMGHDLVPAFAPRVVAAIISFIERTDSPHTA